LESGLPGSARHTSIAVDRIRIAEACYWKTPISPRTILNLRQIGHALFERLEAAIHSSGRVTGYSPVTSCFTTRNWLTTSGEIGTGK
jgi:hypothetical protein